MRHCIKTVKFSSPSLNLKNAEVQIDIHPRDEQKQPRVTWFAGGKTFYSTDAHKLYPELKHSVARTTIYEAADSACGAVAGREIAIKSLVLSGPEHLAPVFLMWPTRSFDVRVGANTAPAEIAAADVSGSEIAAEVPLLDGSALPFLCGLRREAGVPEELSFYEAPVTAAWDLVPTDPKTGAAIPGGKPYGYIKMSPAETFEVEYTVTRPSGWNSSAMVSIYSAEDLYSIFSARTFIFESEYKAACEAGMLQGVDAHCGLLLPDADAASAAAANALKDADKTAATPYRVLEEPARHKILDLLGDLSFVVPALPKIRLEILNGGHISHRQILEKLLPYVSLGNS